MTRVPALLILIAGCGGPPEIGPDHRATPECFAGLAEPLSADDMEGRGVGTEGLAKAADLLEARMADLGLQGPYRQAFEATTGVSLGPANRLGDGVLGEDFTPLGFSASGEFGGDVVFAGYGIKADALGYDDYAGLDVKGKVVLAMRYEPGEDDDASPFDGKKASRWSDLRDKAMRAREAGAAALLFVNPPIADDPDKLPALKSDGPESHAGLPVVQVTRAWVARTFGDGVLEEVHAAIEADGKPHSREIGKRLDGRTDVVPTTATVENVLGVWPGSGALADEVVVVGAHYDHLGWGGRGSFEPDAHVVHNGADDNASGTSAVLCAVGEVMSAPPEGNRRTLLVALFTAEEIGLGGSGHYVNHPRFPLEETVAMVNLDMVGRVRDDRITALGAATAPEWKAWLEAAAAPTGLAVDASGDGYGPSDQMSFYAKGIPVVHLFSGAHEEYHTSRDDFATLNVEGATKVSKLTASLVDTLISEPEAPTYVEVASGPPMMGDSRGYGAYLGTIPDYTTMSATEGGVKLSGVRAGGPADLAGIRGGDTIVEMGGVSIQNLYDMTFVLRDHKPGETIAITVLRDGQPVELSATLSVRGPESSGASAHGGPMTDWTPSAGKDASALLDARETHLADLRQLTFGGENAEAYWSPDGKSLIFQRSAQGGCDQEYVLDLSTGTETMVSSGKGRTTCGYFDWPKGESLMYATTEGASPDCPVPPDRSKGYVWPLYEYDLVRHAWGGQNTPYPSERTTLLPHAGYDAEATQCMRDGRIVFTSTRDGDLDLYVANADGSGLKRITNTPGYDGGAYFTTDCTRIVWRASRPEGPDLEDYKALLAEHLVRPGKLEIFAANPDGSGAIQLTHDGAASFGPYPTNDNSAVIYSSNRGASAREFDLWLVPMAGGEPQRITYTEQFDGFPMYSPDGKWLVFASNRGGAQEGDTNLFLARWVP